jgi:hypothetical protein
LTLDDNAGTGFQYFLSLNQVGSTPSINWLFNEVDDRIQVNLEDDGATPVAFATSETPGTSTVFQTLVAIRRGDTLEHWIDGVRSTLSSGSDDMTGFGAITSANQWEWGRRSDASATRAFGGTISHKAIYSLALVPSEIRMLARDPQAIARLKQRQVALSPFVPYPRPLLPSMTGGMAI